MDLKIKEMKSKIELLNKASKAYYQESAEIIPNIEFDKLYDELVQLETETGITLANSPTVNVGYQVLSDLPKEAHQGRMLSLDKTKDVDTLASFLGNQKGLLSWKLDGLTIVLTYEDGILTKAVTRGNGEIGEVITNNAKVFKNLPVSIPFKGKLVLRGEAIITYSEFERINSQIIEAEAKYKNPRNLCSGSVRQLNNQITAERNVRFYAFALVQAENAGETKQKNERQTDGELVELAELKQKNSRQKQFEWLEKQGFEVVEYRLTTAESIYEDVEWFAEQIRQNDFPSDGLVLLIDDIQYGESLGNTAKFPRSSIAFKWKDEIKETVLKEIEWSASRTGLINPVAIFDPVELEGTTVSRASVHNISIMKQLELGVGDTIEVYKANMIIPQIANNLTRSGVEDIPDVCPVCDGKAEIRKENDVEVLVCTNEKCLAKQIKAFTLFVSRDAMNIDGLSEATMEKFIAKGLIKELADLFHVERFKETIVSMEGFGEKSFENMVESVNKARKTTPTRLLYSLGIPNVGVANAKVICKACNNDWSRIHRLTKEELMEIDGIGPKMADAYTSYFSDEKNKMIVEDILKEIELESDSIITDEREQILQGFTFVITGALEHFENREELKELIENKGGKTTGSVTSKTNYLINNDILSNSSKNKKAKELGVEILTEEEFLNRINTNTF
ncbi:NAD-dependent DNA ligase LigA [Clostridium aminobutyricum]|uniref:DNA ligase n=2 Tax=Clostridium aminobutyricum TaxID=33953 RepID=A0A939IJR8_CLOAM|nr:NAD-dependent DNA ligase LigA [Clostridium aminobutyricum]MBN7773878.1 NAD-dependent DNA ligase LigA [Clostridium aminobutyricum]